MTPASLCTHRRTSHLYLQPRDSNGSAEWVRRELWRWQLCQACGGVIYFRDRRDAVATGVEASARIDAERWNRELQAKLLADANGLLSEIKQTLAEPAGEPDLERLRRLTGA